MDKFKVGDRVRCEVDLYASSGTLKCGKLGTIIGFDRNFILVKWDKFKGGHSAWDYYTERKQSFDSKNKAHYWMFANQLEKVDDNLTTNERK